MDADLHLFWAMLGEEMRKPESVRSNNRCVSHTYNSFGWSSLLLIVPLLTLILRRGH